MKNPKELQKQQYYAMSPGRIVCTLLDKSLTQAIGAREALAQRDYEQVNQRLQNAQDILIHLRAILPENGGEEEQNGRQVLALLADWLCAANLHKDSRRLEEAIQALTRLAAIARYGPASV